MMSATDCMWQTQTVYDRHRLSKTDRKRLSMEDTNCQWQTQTVCDGHRLSVTDTDCLYQTQTVCDRHCLSVTDTDCLWQTQTVCDRHWLCVADTYTITDSKRPTSKINFSGVLLRNGGKLIYALSRTNYMEKIPLTDKKYFLEAWS